MGVLDDVTRQAIQEADDGGDVGGSRPVPLAAVRQIFDEARLDAFARLARAVVMKCDDNKERDTRALLEEVAGVLGIPEDVKQAVMEAAVSDPLVREVADSDIALRRKASLNPKPATAAPARDPAAIADEIHRLRSEMQALEACLGMNTDAKDSIKYSILERRAALDKIVSDLQKAQQ